MPLERTGAFGYTVRVLPHSEHMADAAELGVDHYLGKPYAEDELLGLVARYARAPLAVTRGSGFHAWP